MVRQGHLFVQQSEAVAANFVSGMSISLPADGKPGWRLRLHPDLGHGQLPKLTIVRFDRDVERDEMRGTLKLTCSPSDAGESELSEQRENFRALLSYMSDRAKAAVIALSPLDGAAAGATDHEANSRVPGGGFGGGFGGGYGYRRDYNINPLELVLVPVSMMPSPDAVGFGGDAEDAYTCFYRGGGDELDTECVCFREHVYVDICDGLGRYAHGLDWSCSF